MTTQSPRPMALWVACVLAGELCACSKSPSCPTVDEIARGSAASIDERREYEIVVKQCRSDRWSAQVISCLRDAWKTGTNDEPCFRKLSPPQQERLKAAFEPIEREYVEKDRVELQLGAAEYARELAQPLDALVKRAPTCQGYADGLAAQRKALLACDDALALFGTHQAALVELRALAKIEDSAQVAATCERLAKEAASATHCK